MKHVPLDLFLKELHFSCLQGNNFRPSKTMIAALGEEVCVICSFIWPFATCVELSLRSGAGLWKRVQRLEDVSKPRTNGAGACIHYILDMGGDSRDSSEEAVEVQTSFV